MRRGLGFFLLVLLMGGLWTWTDRWTEQTVLTGPFAPQGGASYSAPFFPRIPVPFVFTVDTDSVTRADSSRLSLMEGGETLGPAHAPHTTIRETGRGAYSHWGSALYFSARDGSDPNTNGRTYTARYPVRVAGGVLLVLGTLSLVLLMPRFLASLAHGTWRENYPVLARLTRYGAVPVVALVGVGFFLHAFTLLPRIAIFSPDTDSYFTFSSMRTVGYPLVLSWMQMWGDSPRALTIVQAGVALISLLVLTGVVERVSQSSFIALLVGVLLVLKDGLFMLHVYVGPDSLFFSFLTLFLAFGLRLICRFTRADLVAMIVCWILAFLLRPSAMGVLPGVGVIAVLWLRDRHWARVGVLAGLVGISLFANVFASHLLTLSAPVASRATEGSVLGTSLFATAGFLLTPATPLEPVEFKERLLPLLAPLRAAYINAEGSEAQYQALNTNYNLVVYSVGLPVAQQWLIEQTGRKPDFPELDRFLLEASRSIIRSDPLAFAEMTGVKIRHQLLDVMTGTWREDVAGTLSYVRTNMMREMRARAYVERDGYRFDVPVGTRLADPFGVKGTVDAHARILNAMVTVCALLWIIVWGVRTLCGQRIGPVVAGGAFASIALLSYCAMVSLVQDPLTRYQEVVSSYGLVVLALAVGGLVGNGWVKGALSRARHTLFRRSAA